MLKQLSEVICINARGYNLTEGNTYKVEELVAQLITPYFTFPRYVVFKDDNNRRCIGHAWRFTAVDGTNMDDFIKEHVPDTGLDKEITCNT